jgi:hypothetical protein
MFIIIFLWIIRKQYIHQNGIERMYLFKFIFFMFYVIIKEHKLQTFSFLCALLSLLFNIMFHLEVPKTSGWNWAEICLSFISWLTEDCCRNMDDVDFLSNLFCFLGDSDFFGQFCLSSFRLLIKTNLVFDLAAIA